MNRYFIQLFILSLSLSACNNSQKKNTDLQTNTNSSEQIINEIVENKFDTPDISNNHEAEKQTFVISPIFSDSIFVFKQIDTTFYKRLITPDESEETIEEAYETEYTTISFHDSLWYFNKKNSPSDIRYTLLTEDYDSIIKISQVLLLDSFKIFVASTIDKNDLNADYVWVFKTDSLIFSSSAKHYDSCEYSELSINTIIKNNTYSALAIEHTYGDIELVNLNKPDDIKYYVPLDYDPTDYRP